MKTQLLFIVLCACLSNLRILAQGTAYVLHVSGQVEYYSRHGAQAQSVSPGMELDMKGKIRCKGSGSAKLLSNGRTTLVSGGKMRDLKDIVGAGESSTGFTGRFLNFVEESVEGSNSDEKLKEHHRQFMNKASGGVKGYASNDYAIKPLLLASGKLPAGPVTFQWRKTAGDGPYTFSLLIPGGHPIAQVQVSDTAVTLDLKQLALDTDEVYEWSITRGNGEKSAAIPIEIAPQSMETAQKAVASSPYYKTASASEQQIMLAYNCEQDQCFYSAGQVYAALSAAEPENALLRRVYAAFLARMDMLPEAVKMAGK